MTLDKEIGKRKHCRENGVQKLSGEVSYIRGTLGKIEMAL